MASTVSLATFSAVSTGTILLRNETNRLELTLGNMGIGELNYFDWIPSNNGVLTKKGQITVVLTLP